MSAEKLTEELRADVERLRGERDEAENEKRDERKRLIKSNCRLSEARALLEWLDDLLEQTMTNTPHPPSYSDWKKGSANIRSWLSANTEAPATAAERAVLDAMAALRIKVINHASNGSSVTQCGDVLPAVRAELARRAVKP